MAAPQVAVVGMAALRRDIRRLTDDQQSVLYAAIKAAGKEAAEPVAARARASVPRVSGALAGTVRAAGNRTGATVRMGRASVPYAGWIDFGGELPTGASRTYVSGGRYLFPAAQGLASTSATLYSSAIGRTLNDSSVWTNSTNSPEAVHD